jgi:precorrin-6Y C5,15-methyltransferase (decarboxylating)
MGAAADVLRDAAVAAICVAQDAAMITVVGIGADGMAGISERARAELHRATVIYGSKRQLDLLDDSVTAPRREWPSPMLPALQELPADADIHIVASGDPLLHGIGGTLIRLHGSDKVSVLPHVSSVALACARMGWNVHDTEVISLVTAQPHTAVRRGGQAIVLSSGGSTPKALAVLLNANGRGDSEFSVLEQLGGPTERRSDGTARDWATATTLPDKVDDLNVIAVRYLPDGRTSSLPDAAFVNDGQITKHGMRAVTLAALAPRPGEVLWDVGAGSGSIAVEWCRSWPTCAAVAYERDERRRLFIGSNATANGVSIDVRGEAPDAFNGAAAPSAIFIGGGLTRPGLLDACLDILPTGGRLVANAVTVESEAQLAQAYSKLGGELWRYQHYHGDPLGGFTGWRPQMPVTQWAVLKP